MSLARKIKRQQMRQATRVEMQTFYAHADKVATDWERKEKALSEIIG